MLHVYRTGRDECVNPALWRWCDRFCGDLNVAIKRPGQTTNRRLFNSRRDCFDSLEISRARYRKTSFYHIDAEPLQRFCDTDFLVTSHRRTWTLLTIP